MNDPDYDVENFWLSFKNSMNNFYIISNIPPRPIKQWSDELNIWKSLKHYAEIEYNIKNYISLYALDIMRINSNYHYRILMTNITRWNNISKNFNYNNNKLKYDNIVFLLLDLYKLVEVKQDSVKQDSVKQDSVKQDSVKHISIEKNEYVNLFSMIELYIIYEDFTPFIRFAINNNKPSILDKISEYCDISKKINNMYNINIDNLSGKKIIQLINST